MVRHMLTRPKMRPLMQLRPVHIGNKPVISLVPPKLNPTYKPSGYVYNKPLPANVPPTIPSRPWQQEGWNFFTSESDNRPFIPSTPLPEANSNDQDHNLIPVSVPTNPPTVFPIIPSTSIQSRPAFQVQPVQHILPQIPLHPVIPLQPPVPVHHVVPIPPHLPTVNLQPALPLPPPIQPPVQPTVHVQPAISTHTLPVHPSVQTFPVHTPLQSNVHTIFQHSPLLPLHYLPGKLNIGVPDLGVLPLGSSVPVQLSGQNSPLFHKMSTLPMVSPVPINLHPQQTHIIHKSPVYPVNTPVIHIAPQQPHTTPVVEPPAVQKFVPEIHRHELPKPQIYLGQPQLFNKIPESNILGDEFTSVEHPFQHNFHMSVNPHDQTMASSAHQIPAQQHNYQYFAQNISPNNVHQYHDSAEQNHEQIQHQEYNETPGFFQPGQTDLQIPDYLPEHPNFKQLQQYQDNSSNAQKR